MVARSGLEQAVGRFGAAVKKKLAATAVSGEREDQLRSPLEGLVADLADLNGLQRDRLVLVGEASLADLKTRPDYAVSADHALVGFIEVKAPGKGADPRRFTGHDREQWHKLQALPNLIYTDGQSFSLWRAGSIIGTVQRLDGDIESAGASLRPASGLLALFADFFSWEPTAPTGARQLAEISARLCRLLRDEVREQLEAHDQTLTALAEDWRHLLFPEATDEQFADGYAQAVTFGILMARARGIELSAGVDPAAKQLGQSHSLIGAALRVLTDQFVKDSVLATSVATLTRVLAAVDWPTIAGGDPEVWLYFYERFLAVYDPTLRRKTGSYYTPPEVVEAMTRLVHEAVQTQLGQPAGLGDDAVVIVDPAMGTGTFLLSVLRRIAAHIEDDLGPGAVGPALAASLHRLIGFELQLGPFAVAQLRLLAELADLGAQLPAPDSLRTYVTDTLGNPWSETEKLGSWYEPIARSRREANEIKKTQPVYVVIGNPPYKDKSHGRGGWIEQGSQDLDAPLEAFLPPTEWGVGVHARHLYNPYVYFWRWAMWKVFDHHDDQDRGVISFITVAGFLDGPGFEAMRAYMRRRCDQILVIDCSPEGHQPAVSTRVFQAVQQPVCIVMAIRDRSTTAEEPAAVHFRALEKGPRASKFDQLARIAVDDQAWEPCPIGWRDPFLPQAEQTWAEYPALEDLLGYSGTGVMSGRTWIVAPDTETLTERWSTLTAAKAADKPRLLSEHARDRRVDTVVRDGLPGYAGTLTPIGQETGPSPGPVRIGYRSFDRQWIIPDKRLINRPNPALWATRSEHQVYLTAPLDSVASSGPALTFTAFVPDVHHYKGSFGGRVFPLWLDAAGTVPNLVPGLLEHLAVTLGAPVSAPDVYAYLAALVAHPGYTARFTDDLEQPGLRIPLTADPELYARATDLGRRVIWLHTYGERFVAPPAGRPAQAPRLPRDRAPRVARDHPIPTDPAGMPDTLTHDPATGELRVGDGVVERVTERMADYDVSGVNVLTKWFSYRRRTREKPVMGDRRVSPLQGLQLDRWPSHYTSELIDLLHVLGLLADLEPDQAALLDAIVTGPTITATDLHTASVLPVDSSVRKPPRPTRTEPADQLSLDDTLE